MRTPVRGVLPRFAFSLEGAVSSAQLHGQAVEPAAGHPWIEKAVTESGESVALVMAGWPVFVPREAGTSGWVPRRLGQIA